MGDVVEGRVAADSGDSGEVDVGVSLGEKDGDGVVDTGVAVQDDGGGCVHARRVAIVGVAVRLVV